MQFNDWRPGIKKQYLMNNKRKVVWITGASSGIGAELARQYSNFGVKLILSSRRADVLEQVKSECSNSENIKILPFDLIDFKSCLLYTSPSPRDATLSRMPSSA